MINDGNPAIVMLDDAALPLAQKLKSVVGGEILAPALIATPSNEVYEALIPTLRELFSSGRPIIGICASGILIRALAPLLADKKSEPPVIAVQRDGTAVVPLLGGHHGANELARVIAKVLGVEPAITTAGDIAFGVALDQPPTGWRLRSCSNIKTAMAALLAGRKAKTIIEDGPNPDWLANVPQSANGEVAVTISVRADAQGDLIYAPGIIALGVGCERSTPDIDVESLAMAALAEANVAPEAIACIASIDLKMDERAIHSLARKLSVPARFFDAARLEEERYRLLNPSDLVFRETGCHGVAEGAALACVGGDGSLILPKKIGGRATVALSKATNLIDATGVGRARGRLSILGIGPGVAEGRTLEVQHALHEASDLVGYGLYLDLLGDLNAEKRRHGMALGQESERARLALDLAAEGRDVALVSSGDAGIYAMASLVFELIDREKRSGWSRLDIRCLPGVSAMQTAAARAGAPLGHDFCAISLSDLLTPWSEIEARLEAAGASDFVVALYNPVSARRTEQIQRAREILLRHRPPSTPVVIARNLGRERESTRLADLGSLNSVEIDMLTVLIIGSTTTSVIRREDGGFWVYTPRGYERKSLPKAGVAK